jgi:hypothetical protein
MKSAMIRMALVLAGAATLVILAVFAPLLLRRIDAFSVQRVEVSGLRYLAADGVVAAAGISATSNVFDDAWTWRDAVLRHPGVRAVSITRELPGTLRLHVTESAPVAFARTPELRAVDERGFVLPIDPASDGLDLPVISDATRVSAAGRAADEATQRVAAFLGTVQRLEPGLLGWISEVGSYGSAVRLVLRNAADAEVLLPALPDAERLRELHLTLADLAAPRFATPTEADTAGSANGAAAAAATRSAEPELARVMKIDGRFHDQIVVALYPGKN